MDELTQLRDYFYAGYNNHCLSLYEQMKGEERKEAEEYILQIHMLKNTRTDLLMNLRTSPNDNLVALYWYYRYYYLGERENIIPDIRAIKTTSANACILRSRIFFDHEHLDDCFDLLENGTIEMKAARMYFLLKINRVDLAKEIIDEFMKINDEIPIIRIALAVFGFYNDNSKESFLIFDDLESFYSSVVQDSSGVLFNGKGVAHMMGNEFMDAREHLSSRLGSELEDGDVLCNLVACSLHLNELEESSELLRRLCTEYPQHESVGVLRKIDEEVDAFTRDD